MSSRKFTVIITLVSELIVFKLALLILFPGYMGFNVKIATSKSVRLNVFVNIYQKVTKCIGYSNTVHLQFKSRLLMMLLNFIGTKSHLDTLWQTPLTKNSLWWKIWDFVNSDFCDKIEYFHNVWKPPKKSTLAFPTIFVD